MILGLLGIELDKLLYGDEKNDASKLVSIAVKNLATTATSMKDANAPPAEAEKLSMDAEEEDANVGGANEDASAPEASTKQTKAAAKTAAQAAKAAAQAAKAAAKAAKAAKGSKAAKGAKKDTTEIVDAATAMAEVAKQQLGQPRKSAAVTALLRSAHSLSLLVRIAHAKDALAKHAIWKVNLLQKHLLDVYGAVSLLARGLTTCVGRC